MQSTENHTLKQQSYSENEFRSILLCIDAYEERNLVGRLYNPYFGKERYFHNAMQFLMLAESLFDQMDFPQHFASIRKFWTNETVSLQSGSDRIPRKNMPKRGKIASFYLKVVFRQNASWQGSIKLLDQNREESFRSALELLKILDNALSDKMLNLNN